MTAQFLQTELTNLVQEAKRKNSDLRNAAEKALQELRTINLAGDVEAELSLRPGLLSPFLMACGTRNSKFSTIGITCLQRLIISKALAKSRLREVLEAFREAANLGVDVQLKILQALPPLLQNYAGDLQGPLLGEALMVCAVLQGSKTSVVNNTAAATLSQIVISIFDKVVTEDEKALELPTVGEAPSASGMVPIRAAALDAYRVFYDICLLTEGQKPMYHRFNTLPQPFGLELIESVLTNHPDIFLSHPEQAHTLQTRVAPLVIRSLSDRLNFPTTVRITRILYILLRRHLSILTSECEASLVLLIHMLESDASQPWKRALCMEVFKGVFHEPVLIRKIFSQFDGKEDGKPIIRELMGALTRLSTEKPAIIGLGSQSTAASLAQQLQSNQSSSEQVAIEAGGVAGIIGAVGIDTTMTGIGSWSVIRVPCIDQLDKSEPPAIPDSYIYYLTLVCLNSFSDGLAKFILPMAAGTDASKRRSRLLKEGGILAGSDSEAGGRSTPVDRAPSPAKSLRRKPTSRSHRVPINPLTLDSHPLYPEIVTASAIVETCWPAVLAACSTFLNATMENELYHALVRSFQKFAHVAGLLRLDTPRDAFLTTLGKAAVPSNILSANMHSTPLSTPTAASGESISSIAKGYLGVDSSISSASAGHHGDHYGVSALNVRHLRCLRALLNLGIALGSTLGTSWAIILETLQQADFVLYTSTKRGNRQQPSAGPHRTDSFKPSDSTNLMANIGSELTAVESAANKMLECTRDFPDEGFVDILTALCKLLNPEDDKSSGSRISVDQARSLSPTTTSHKRLSTSTAPSSISQLIGDNAFALAKIGEVALINMGRLIGPDDVSSGWTLLANHLVSVIRSRSVGNSLRYKAAEVLNEVVVGVAKSAIPENVENVGQIQRRALKALKDGIEQGHTNGELDSATKTTELEIHHAGLEALNAILEHSGQSLVDGWDITFDIIDSVFDSSQTWKYGRSSKSQPVSNNVSEVRTNRSVRLIRSSFASLVLICSDFLASLPTDCVLVLIDALFAFCSQKDDLNISLTTITFFWNVSAFLQTRGDQDAAKKADELTAQAKNEMDLLNIVDQKDVDPHSALWMLLLLRLTGASTDHRAEVRNGSIQTLFRIFDTYGDQLGPQGWSSCLEIVVFKMMNMDPKNMMVSISEKAERKQWDDTIKLVLGGIGTLYSNYFDVFAQQKTFRNTWTVFVRYLESLLSWRSYEVSTSVFDVLSRVLEKVEDPKKMSTESIQEVWILWSSQGVGLVEGNAERTGTGIQDTLTSYINSFRPLYSLLQPILTVDMIRRTLEIIKDCILFPDAPPYFRDVDALTPLQIAVLEVVQLIRTDIPEVPSLLLSRLADISTIAYTHTFDTTVTGRVPTCIALSVRVMEVMQNIVSKHINNSEIYISSAVSQVFTALEVPINLKYTFDPPPKRSGQWMFATKTVLEVAKQVIPAMETLSDVPSDIKGSIWDVLVTIVGSVIRASGNEAVEEATLRKDEAYDIEAFTELRKLMIPGLGQDVVSHETILRYVKAVFWTSMLYKTDGLNNVEDGDDNAWLVPRRYGATTELVLERRKRMCYVCIDELFSLVAASSGGGDEVGRLAGIAVPWLIRRVGIVLGSFIADQPLRGLMPQPVSQRKEIMYLLEGAINLESGLHTVQLEGLPCIPPSSKRHLFKLFPLFTRCVVIAQNDQELLVLLSKALGEMGDALNIC